MRRVDDYGVDFVGFAADFLTNPELVEALSRSPLISVLACCDLAHQQELILDWEQSHQPQQEQEQDAGIDFDIGF